MPTSRFWRALNLPRSQEIRQSLNYPHSRPDAARVLKLRAFLSYLAVIVLYWPAKEALIEVPIISNAPTIIRAGRH